MSEIIIENLRYRYPHAKKLALDGLNFSVKKGEFIGIIGENGAGKSTLMKCIFGMPVISETGGYLVKSMSYKKYCYPFFR